MNRRLKKHLLILPLIGALWVLFACAPEERITIVITPTPAAVVDLPTTTPTLTSTTESTVEITPSPSATNTNTDEPPIITPTETPQPLPTVGEGTQIGPIIPPDYVLPTLVIPSPIIPTITPIPVTATPTGPTATPIPTLDAYRMGLQLYSNVGQAEWESYVQLAERTGVLWIKIQVNWAFLQPDAPNVMNDQMQLFERQVEAASRPPNMRVMLSIAKAPSWARSVNSEDGPPDNPQALADFITFMLTQTKIGGAVDAIEIWNEPNLIREWRGTLPFNGAGYMQLFAPSYNAIRAFSPTIQVITAGLAPTGNIGDATVDDRTFLQQMYGAGLGNYGSDVFVGVHPYGWGNAPDARCCNTIPDRGWDDDPHFFFIQNIEDLYTIMQNNRHGAKMWITEFGWATWEGLPTEAPELWMTYNTARDQLNHTIRAFQIGQSMSYIEGMILWNLNFGNIFRVEQRDEVAGYSIINPALLPAERPLYGALSQATGYGQ